MYRIYIYKHEIYMYFLFLLESTKLFQWMNPVIRSLKDIFVHGLPGKIQGPFEVEKFKEWRPLEREKPWKEQRLRV